MEVYHGSNQEIKKPNLHHSKSKLDFGKGFYLTKSIAMASEWAADKNPSVVNTYELDLSGLKVCQLQLDEVWLNYVAKNRGFIKTTFNDNKYDVIIGPTADNGMHKILRDYVKGHCSSEEALQYITGRNLSEQILLRTEKAITKLEFLKSCNLSREEVMYFKEKVSLERQQAAKYIVNKEKHKDTVNISNFIDLDGYEKE